jgi:hypothetical protein
MAEDNSARETDGDPNDLDAVADRLETALDRIVRRLEAPPARPGTEFSARLDGLIGRLRDVLGHPPGPPPGPNRPGVEPAQD